MTAQALQAARLVASCALLTAVLLGALGMKDSHRAKLPLTAIGAILGWAGLTRMGIIKS